MKRLLTVAVLAAAMMLAISAPALATDRDVPSEDYPTIQAGINAAEPGDTVVVAAGTYNESFALNRPGVTVQGAGADVTEVTGVATISNVGPDTKLDGFTFSGFQNYSIVTNLCGSTISNNVINNGNSGMYIGPSLGGVPTIINNTITGTLYGGIYSFNCTPTIINNTITGIQYPSSAAIYLEWTWDATIMNNTIADNNTEGMRLVPISGAPIVVNNIVVGNAVGIKVLALPMPVFSYNDVWGNGTDYWGGGVGPGATDISVDPQFVGGGDYHLRKGSPCIDVGTNEPVGSVYTVLPDYDFEGQARVVDGNADGTAIVDMGADEYVNLPPVADAGPDQTLEQTSIAGVEVTLDGSGSSDPNEDDVLTYTWTWNGGSATGVSPDPVLFPLGPTEVTLTVSDGQLTSEDTVIINVTPATIEGLGSLIEEQLEAGGVDARMETSLSAKVDAALAALARGNANDVKVAINNLEALINHVEAQAGKKITEDSAAVIIAKANAVIAALGD